MSGCKKLPPEDRVETWDSQCKKNNEGISNWKCLTPVRATVSASPTIWRTRTEVSGTYLKFTHCHARDVSCPIVQAMNLPYLLHFWQVAQERDALYCLTKTHLQCTKDSTCVPQMFRYPQGIPWVPQKPTEMNTSTMFSDIRRGYHTWQRARGLHGYQAYISTLLQIHRWWPHHTYSPMPATDHAHKPRFLYTPVPMIHTCVKIDHFETWLDVGYLHEAMYSTWTLGNACTVTAGSRGHTKHARVTIVKHNHYIKQ